MFRVKLDVPIGLDSLRREFNQAVRRNVWDKGSVTVHGTDKPWMARWVAHYIQKDEMPACNILADSIPGQTYQLRWLVLGTGSILPRHADIETPKQYRFHIPVVTDKWCTFVVWDKAGEPYNFAYTQGECWFLDPSYEHFCANGSPNDRVHLCIDKIADPEVDAWVLARR